MADAAYLVTWNPDSKPWPELENLAEQTLRGHLADEWWNVANQGIAPGARVFLLKQGAAPTGIMGAGRARTRPRARGGGGLLGLSVGRGLRRDARGHGRQCLPRPGLGRDLPRRPGRARTDTTQKRPHWDNIRASRGDTVNYIDIDWEVILNPGLESLLAETQIHGDGLPQRLWNARNSGNTIAPVVAQRLENLWEIHVVRVRGLAPNPFGDSSIEELEFPEGREIWRLHHSHERNPRLPELAKAAALARGETISCAVCEFDFWKTYGELGKDFIECHHILPVSELKEGMMTKLSDVVLVCSNCHRMLHRKRPWLTVGQLKALLPRTAEGNSH